MKIQWVALLLWSVISLSAKAQTTGKLQLSLKQQTGEYHAPYTAAWIENERAGSVRSLLLWRDDPKWLKDIRRWWRKVGRKDAALVDAITSATRVAGNHTQTFSLNDDDQKPLAAGRYTLLIEVVREKGGRELIRMPFELDGTDKNYNAKGSTELGKINFSIQHKFN